MSTTSKKRKDDIRIDPESSKRKKNTPILDAIIVAIRKLQSANGSSAVKIVKEIKASNDLYDEKQIKKALKKAAENGQLTMVKASYQVTGDPLYEDQTEHVTIEDSTEGTGVRVVEKGDSIIISYKGSLLDSGKVFDKAARFTFQVGSGDVVKGMDQGVIGLKIGGKRKITIPASLGYGKRGSSPDIPPNSTLMFEISLREFMQ